MREADFPSLLDQAIQQSGKSLGQVTEELRQRGYTLNKSTLSRWLNRTSQPTSKRAALLYRLPELLTMSFELKNQYLKAVDCLIHGEVTLPGSLPLPYREHLLWPESFFTGRTKEVAQLEACVLRGQSVIIYGLGGIGKTTLAQHLLQKTAAHFRYGCEALHLLPEQGLPEVVEGFLKCLAWPSPAETITVKNIFFVLDELRRQLLGLRMVFLLDNVTDLRQVKELMRHLPHVTWVLTSRVGLDDPKAFPLQLEPPSTETAIQMLLYFAGEVPGERGTAEKIVTLLGQHPLALRMVGGLVNTKRFKDLPELWTWLSQRPEFKTFATSEPMRQLFSHLLEGVPGEVQDLFSLFGMFAHWRIQRLAYETLASMLNFQLELLGYLANLSLVYWHAEEALYELHPLVHEYAMACWQTSQDQQRMTKAFIAYYGQFVQANRSLHPLLHEEFSNISLAVERAYMAQTWETLKAFWGPVSEHLWIQSDWDRYVEFDRKCLEGAQALQDHKMEAVIRSEIGWVFFEEGQYEAAERWFLQAQALHDAFQHTRESGRLRRYLAELSLARKELQQAQKLLEESENLLKSHWVGEDWQKLALAFIRNVETSLAIEKGDFATAHTKIQAALALTKELDEPSFKAGFSLHLGDVLAKSGDLDGAYAQWSLLAHSRTQNTRIEQRIIADAQRRLAEHEARYGSPEKAKYFAQLALAIYRRRGRQADIQEIEKLLASLKEASLP